MGNESSKGSSLTNKIGSKKDRENYRNAHGVTYKVTSKSETDNAPKPLKPVRLFVISAHSDENFYKLFKNCSLLDGRKIEVEQSGWGDFSLTTYSEGNQVVCTLREPRRPIPNTPQESERGYRTFIPNFCLVRNVCHGIRKHEDRRNLLYGLMVGNLPSINSLMSIYCMLDRPLMNAELIKINRKYGQEQFPILHINYYPVSEEMIISPQYPIVCKIGHGHAGFGKMKLQNHKDFIDLKSVVACTDMYCTAERYIEGKCDLRIQKIGYHYRSFRRESISGNWKTNTGSSHFEEIELLPRYKFWADECCKSFGGLDICTVDVLVSEKDGTEYILEFNGTASGFGYKHRDNEILKDYTLEKMNRHFCPDLLPNDINDNNNGNDNQDDDKKQDDDDDVIVSSGDATEVEKDKEKQVETEQDKTETEQDKTETEPKQDKEQEQIKENKTETETETEQVVSEKDETNEVVNENEDDNADKQDANNETNEVDNQENDEQVDS